MQKVMQKIRCFKKQNSGSTLIVVLIAVCFITVLATMLLSVSSVNLQMKQANYEMKRDSYSNERALDDVYNGIGKAANECMATAYSKILSEIQDTTGKSIYTTQDAAYKAFAKAFTENLKAIYPTDVSNDPVVTALLNSYIVDATEGEVDSYREIETKETSITNDTPYQFIFRDVNVRFYRFDNAGVQTDYEASITTDIVIEVPYISFFQDSSNLLDYAMVANKGIYFDNAQREIYGNVYGGTDTAETPDNIRDYRDIDVYGGINMYLSKVNFNDINYLVSKGDINVRATEFKVEPTKSTSNTQIWAESLRTVESGNKSDPVESPIIDVKGNTFLANDLELNARNSKVELSGALYAYNNKVYATQEKDNLGTKYDTSDHTMSSSILINGTKSNLNLSGLNTMVVAGLAYIDLKSNAYAATQTPITSTIHEYATGESLALRTNQYMYLAPSSCLLTTNPVKLSEEPVDGIIWKEGMHWFGTDLMYVDSTDPLVRKEITNNTTGETYVYYFLNFINDDERIFYANLVLNMPAPDENGIFDFEQVIDIEPFYSALDTTQMEQVWEAKKYIKATALAEQSKSIISIPTGTTANIYSRGVLSMSDGVDLGTTPIDPAQKLSTDQVARIEENVYRHFPWFYLYLDPKEQFSFDSNMVPDSPTIIDDKMPLSAYLDLSTFANNGSGPSYMCNSSYHTYIRPSDFTITDADFKGIILCDGDVTVANGCSVEGIILATGRIYVKGNGTIKANRAIVQQILDEEMKDENRKEEDDITRNFDYACSYFKEYKPVHAGNTNHRVTGTDYKDYISFANWRKSE